MDCITRGWETGRTARKRLFRKPGLQQVNIKGTVSREVGEQVEQQEGGCSGDRGAISTLALKGLHHREVGEQVEQQEGGCSGDRRHQHVIIKGAVS